MATSKAQRTGILVIAIVMLIGTIFSFFTIILQNSNAQIDAERTSKEQEQMQKEFDEWNKKYTAYQEEVKKESEAIEKKYGSLIKDQKDAPAKFDESKVKELKIKDIKKGDGEDVKDINSMRAYYIGWNKDGKDFDSSIDSDGNLKAPLDTSMGVIEGWNKGVEGMKIGGVRELTIPSDLAYGSSSPGDDIPANSALKFILVALPASKIKEPAMSESLNEALMQQPL